MATIAKLPKPDETEHTFIPTNSQAYLNHLDYAKYNFEFSLWKENLFNQIKTNLNNPAKNKSSDPSKNQNDLDSDDEDEDEIDDDIYLDIPADYNFDIQAKLANLDAKTWRENDHYKVLGLNDFRWRTRPEDLKKAYRALVLKYHPDKGKYRQQEGKNVKNVNLNDVFSCLTKSYEFLSKPSNRRSFDSYEPEFDDSIPNAMKQGKNCDPDQFFQTFTNVFERNSRWSRHALPEFGDNNSTFDEVNDFYSCWYEFESWREFTYEKLEDLEKAEGRWERRDYAMQIKKENKIRRKEEIKRLRKLVDNAYNSDPRIKRFQREELERKEAEKLKRRQEKEAKRLELQRIENEKLEAERKKQEAIDAENKRIKDAEKKNKETQKKLLKRSRQNLRKKLVEIFTEETAASFESELTLICSQLEATEIDELRDSISSQNDKNRITEKYNEVKENLNAANQKQQEEKNKKLQQEKKDKEWSVSDLQILVKAANTFPAGTAKRWDKLAAYINDHSENTNSNRSAKDCMNAVKKLSESAANSKGGPKDNEDSFEQFLRQRKHANESKPQGGEISVKARGEFRNS